MDATRQDAVMPPAEWEDFVYSAGFLDVPDTAASWRECGERVEAVADYLATKRELRIVADGTDLRLSTEGRTWISSKGRENFPDGEVFTGPVETSVEGQIRFSYPAIFNGREVEDVRLRFEGGEV